MPCSTRLDLMIVVDCSDSFTTIIGLVRAWIKALVQSFDLSASSEATTSRIGLVKFTGNALDNSNVAQVVTQLTGNEATLFSGIESLSAEVTLTCISCGAHARLDNPAARACACRDDLATPAQALGRRRTSGQRGAAPTRNRSSS